MDDAPRYAVYFAPDASSALWTFGSSVVGRDAALGSTTAYPPELTAAFPHWEQMVAPARHYGFHATLKAPFSLKVGVDETELVAHVATLAASLKAVALGHLTAWNASERFVALVPVAAPAALGALAAEVVRRLDPLRAPLSDADRQRRKPELLSPRQRAYLEQWGYPHVLEEFRFHMTLTGPLGTDERTRARTLLADLYQPLDRPVTIDQICIFSQPRRDAPFRLIQRFRLAD